MILSGSESERRNMANTPIGYEIQDFLTALQNVGEQNPKYNSYVRKYTRFRKKEIRRGNAANMESYRIRRWNSVADVLLVLGWAAFFGTFFFLLVLPVIKAREVHLSSMIESMNVPYATVLSAASVAFYCFAVYFKSSSFRRGVIILTAIWSAFTVFCRVAVMGPYLDINSKAWVVFGNLTIAFVLIIILSVRFGTFLHRRLLEPGDGIRDMKHVFSPFEVIFLILMILLDGGMLYFLADVNRFYALVEKSNVMRIVFLAIPVVIFLLYTIWHANRSDGESVNAWFCASMEVYATATILQIFAIPNLLRGLMLWVGLAGICIVVLIYLGSIIGDSMAFFTIGMIALNFIVSASINYYSEDPGIYVIGVATHWWMVAPAFLTVAVAIGLTVREMVREKL